MNTTHYLDELNPLQRRAVETTMGPVMIVAGAGTGKTKTLTYRMYHLIRGGVSGRNILGITFTNKAASEMRERVHVLVGDNNETPTLKTFHGLGVMMLRMFYAQAGLPKNFNILDSSDTGNLIKEVMQEQGIDPKTHDPRKIRSVISLKKNQGVTPSQYAEKTGSAIDDIIAKIWERYEQLKKRDGGVDFDDLLILTKNMLEKNIEVRNHFQKLWQYIHVDEYQDTNQIQYDIVKLLVGPEHNLCVVGDSDQNIYSWRGANLKNMLNFERDYPESVMIILEQNYRSTKNILDAASHVIGKNTARIEKKLVTDADTGEHIDILECMDGYSEAKKIASSIKEYIASGTNPSQIAILYRTNSQSRIFEEILLQNSIPYKLIGTKFFERKEVKDIMSYIRLAYGAQSMGDIRRVVNEPKRGLGPVALAKITAGNIDDLSAGQLASYRLFEKTLGDIQDYGQNHTTSETVRYVIERTGIYKQYTDSGTSEDVDRLENLEELVTVATKYDEYPPNEGMQALLEEGSLHSDQDDIDNVVDGVHMMTVHSAKGLEFDVVYIAGMEMGLFPHAGHDKRQTIEDREEERRLFYVALTRARKKLTLSYARARTIFGSLTFTMPSEFLNDIPVGITRMKNDWSDNHGDDTDDTGSVKTVYLDW